MSQRVRKQLLYEGRVQGVGFRITTRRLASGFPVSGFVRNLSDGRVELVVEGDEVSVQSFLAAISREFADMVTNIESTPLELSTTPSVGFSILS